MPRLGAVTHSIAALVTERNARVRLSIGLGPSKRKARRARYFVNMSRSVFASFTMSSSGAVPVRGPLVDDAWSFARRLGFRLIFGYFGLYLLLCWLIARVEVEAAFGLTPGTSLVIDVYSKTWAPIVAWTGKHVLHLDRPVAYEPGGNSDGVYGYAQLFCVWFLAVFVALVWTMVDRARTEYRRLNDWLRICLNPRTE